MVVMVGHDVHDHGGHRAFHHLILHYNKWPARRLILTAAQEFISRKLKRSHGLLKGFKGNACLDEHADEHIAADT